MSLLAVRAAESDAPTTNLRECAMAKIPQQHIKAVRTNLMRARPDEAVPTDAVIETALDLRTREQGQKLKEELDGPDRQFVVTPAFSITPRPVFWAWKDRIPCGEITITPGYGGIGKSSWHCWMIARVTRGELPGEWFGVPRNCFIAATEDSWAKTIIPRLSANGADLTRVFRVEVETQDGGTYSLNLPTDLDALEAAVREYDVALISIDPLLGVVDGNLNTHKDAEVRQALEPIRRLADRTGCVILGNAHFNKSGGSKASFMVMGSAAFYNVPRASLAFARDEENGCVVISQDKNNLGRNDLPSLSFEIESAVIETPEGPATVGKVVMLGESSRSVNDILSETASSGANKLDDVTDWLVETLSNGPMLSSDVKSLAEDECFTPATLKRAVRELRSTDVLTIERDESKQGRPTTWSLTLGYLSEAS